MNKNPLRSEEEEMGQDASLDFDKICKIGRCPTRSTARSCHRRDDLLVFNDKFLEINFGKHRRVSCKSVPRPKGIQSGLEVNRGLVYESSSEVGRMRIGKGFELRRRKIELPLGSDTSSCLSIVDSLCSSDDDIESSRSSVISRSSRATVTLKCDCSSQPSSAEGLRRNYDGQSGDAVRLFSKSFSVKAEGPPPPFVSESCRSSQSSSRTRFSAVKKMLDPLVKSKSLQRPLSHMSEVRLVSNHVTEPGKIEECRFRNPGPSMKDSPVQLHGLLVRKEKHRIPLIEFSVNCPEEALVAKTRKENKSFDWVYTFHSLDNWKKTIAGGTVSEDCRRESVMIGQMKVCCQISSEPRSDGCFHDSSVTEFVLYDTAHVMRSMSRFPSRTSPALARRTNRVDDISTATKLRQGTRRDTEGRDHPLASVELGPELEVAAIVVQVPCAKSESLEYQRGDNCIADMVNVVVPVGNHGLPKIKGSRPSPLLERWRMGGDCDCGGWDMACPLIILGNPSIKFDDRILVDEDKPLRLNVQGTKDRIPALTMKFLEEGFYEIDFHARLSSLQAFSICIAMLHSIDAIKASRDEDERNPGHGDSPEMLLMEGGQFSVDPIWKMVNVTAPSYLINPPFSPIARV